MKSSSLKTEIIALRNKRLKYEEIKAQLGCTMSLISYHCKNAGLATKIKVTKEIKLALQNKYDEGYSIKYVAELFQLSKSTVQVNIKARSKKRFTDNEYKHRVGDQQKLRRKRLKQILVEYKGGKCERCGYDKCIRSLQFHHINAKEKEFLISYGTYALEKLKKEVDKCELVCANCHGEIEEQEYYKNKI